MIDPGEDDDRHLRAVAAHGPVALVLLTHRHHDHAGGARRFAELTGAPVRALDPSLVLGSEALADGDVVAAAGVELRVVATPGHTSDSLSFLLTADEAVLTGDTVLGRGTTVIAHPDGALGPYLESLRRLADLAPGTAVLTGPRARAAGRRRRSPPPTSPTARSASNRCATPWHRLGPQASPRAVVEDVYADVDRALWPAAELSVRAQLDYLRA